MASERGSDGASPGGFPHPDNLREVEPKTSTGRYNVRGPGGEIVKRGSREYYRALGIERGAGEYIPVDERAQTAGDRRKASTPKAGSPQAEPAVTVSAPRSKRPIPPVSRQVSKKEAERQSAQSTTVLLTIFDGLAGLSFGEGARMEPHERAIIEEPMARIMARMDPGTSAAIERWTDPILLIFGFASWGVRVYMDLAEQSGSDDDETGWGRGPETEPEPPPPSREHETVPSASPPIEVMAGMGYGPPVEIPVEVREVE